MHKRCVSHRDLKPENILLMSPEPLETDSKGRYLKEPDPLTFEVKICDLGAAKVLDLDKHMNTPYVVSRYYRAPELIFGRTHYTNAVDIWSAGCVIAELILGQPIFPGESGVD